MGWISIKTGRKVAKFYWKCLTYYGSPTVDMIVGYFHPMKSSRDNWKALIIERGKIYCNNCLSCLTLIGFPNKLPWGALELVYQLYPCPLRHAHQFQRTVRSWVSSRRWQGLAQIFFHIIFLAFWHSTLIDINKKKQVLNPKKSVFSRTTEWSIVCTYLVSLFYTRHCINSQTIGWTEWNIVCTNWVSLLRKNINIRTLHQQPNIV